MWRTSAPRGNRLRLTTSGSTRVCWGAGVGSRGHGDAGDGWRLRPIHVCSASRPCPSRVPSAGPSGSWRPPELLFMAHSLALLHTTGTVSVKSSHSRTCRGRAVSPRRAGAPWSRPLSAGALCPLTPTATGRDGVCGCGCAAPPLSHSGSRGQRGARPCPTWAVA